MKKKIKVSVIIPVYQVDKYLSECIESVLKQTYQNIEIILVNDGSKDQSPIICNKYAELYPNIKVIHKVNGGLSDARNCGLKEATGDYVAFLDGDDFWDNSEVLEKLVERLKITQADVLNFLFVKYFEDTRKKTPYFYNASSMPVNLKTKKEQLQFLLTNRLYISSACNKLIKREIFSNCLFFEKGVYSEDVEWSAHLLQEARTMDFVFLQCYCYRQRKNSISHTINDKKSNDLCKHIIECIKMAESACSEERDILFAYAAYQFGTYFVVQANATNQQKSCIEILSEYESILKYHYGNKKIMILNIGCRIFGYKNVCKMIRLIYQCKRKVKI